jgi:hypothetical protein
MLLEGMADTVRRVITEVALGGFYTIHHELTKLLKHDEAEASDSLAAAARSLPPEIMIRFCRASAERVAQWRKEGKTTNDIAYGHSLSGGSTSELIALTFESAADREHARRELAPIIDILADAGLRDIASQLRSKLRHA